MPHLRDGQAAPAAIFRADYQAPAWWIDSVELTFDLDPAKTRVLNRMRVRRNAAVPAQPLRLDGEDLNLARVLVGGAGTSFKMEAQQLVLENLPEGTEPVELEIFTTCAPEKNTQLSGLYVSQGAFFTQCEAEGFRRITYFLDRPDVMASFTVLLRADKAAYPVLLSNGNLVEQGELDGGRHFAKWVDPHKKPCYLFALVAGTLVARQQRIVSRSGQEHLLEVYVRPGDLGKTEHAMNSLMASVAWDEARFGLSLDLDRFMVVATSDFNMGAMENKGLNIFNTKYVLASEATATDTDFANIESVVGHEYFHNWTGNRVTCRDWFQLSLKEGLTVFRDQEFSADMGSRAVKRIEDVKALRAMQFPEDAGPMAHPIRPESYIEMNNFYTMTVYEKGAEVVRMYHTLLGEEGFQKGMRLYVKRHDGQAATCDDFRAAMADANGVDLTRFGRWYTQAGTPHLAVSAQYSELGQTLTLTVRQTTPPTPGQPDKQPLHIPLAIGLLAPDGRELPLTLAHDNEPGPTRRVLSLTEAEQHFTFVGIEARPVPSLLRGFSAPVRLDYPYTDAELAFLLANDPDDFARWEAGQTLAGRVLRTLYAADAAGEALEVPDEFIAAWSAVLGDHSLDPAFVALALTLPGETELLETLEEVDPVRLVRVRELVRRELGRRLRSDWLAVYEACSRTEFSHEDKGWRALKQLSLACLVAAGEATAVALARQQVAGADNMTDQIGALVALRDLAAPEREAAFSEFGLRWQDDALVMDKWFALQAAASREDTLEVVQGLMQHPAFALSNPNKVRALLGSFGRNLAVFHRADGAGYALMADQVLAVDAINPQVAARLVTAFNRWRKVDPARRELMQAALQRIAAAPDLSKDVYEIVSKSLALDD